MIMKIIFYIINFLVVLFLSQIFGKEGDCESCFSSNNKGTHLTIIIIITGLAIYNPFITPIMIVSFTTLMFITPKFFK